MDVTILGCGTSTGVPIVGCDCSVCRSTDPRNKRLRASVVIHLDSGQNILIDTSPDLRRQALDNNLRRVDAVFYTHCHADHTHGIDEMRTYNYLQKSPVDVFGVNEHIEHVQRQFAYIFQETVQKGGGKPNLDTHIVDLMTPFQLYGETVTPLRLWHGKLLSVGWRVGDFAYCTDVNYIPEETFGALAGVRVLILGALRWGTHPTHFTIEQAAEAAQRIGAEQTFITHMGHEVDFEGASHYLNGMGIMPAYDGQRITV
jgi:phosphoribosyl 1,2-cyclic phosphate phosphodiesterase